MSGIREPAAPACDLLEGYIPESEMTRARDVNERTLRSERARGDGPPWVRINRAIFYPRDGFREWLRSIEQRPVRARRPVERQSEKR
jgi:hypothetical protein